MVLSAANGIKEFLQDSIFARIPYLAEFLSSLVDLLSGPLTGFRTAHYWPYIAGSLLVAAIVFFLQKNRDAGRGLSGFLRFCFPKSIWSHPSTLLDIKIKIANNFLGPFYNFTWRLNGVFFTGVILSGLLWTFGPQAPLFDWNTTTLVVFTVLFAVMEDLGFYAFHLASHKIPMLWAFHKVHHSAEVLTPLTATRAHPLELVLTAPCRAVPAALAMAPAIYLSGHQPTLVEVLGISLAAAFFAAIGNQLLHSHLWISWGPALERVITSPAQHQIHHSRAPHHFDRNFGGVFSLWDWMFGTLYLARHREQITFGVHGETQPHPGLLAAYLVPFRDALPYRHALSQIGLAAVTTRFRRLSATMHYGIPWLRFLRLPSGGSR